MLQAYIVAVTLAISFGSVIVMIAHDAITDRNMRIRHAQIVRDRKIREFNRICEVRNTFSRNTI